MGGVIRGKLPQGAFTAVGGRSCPGSKPRKRESDSLDISEYKLTDVSIPLFSVCWFAREFFGFARNDGAPPAAGMDGADAPTAALPSLSPGVRRDAFGRRDLYIAALIAACFYLLCIWRLGVPNEQIFDEVHHARTAMEYVDGLNPHEWSHPPFSKEMIALSIKAWGGEFDPRDGAWRPDMKFPPRDAIAWRFASVLFGTLTLPAIYALAWALFGNRSIATASALLLAADGVFFVQSRVAMTNIFTLFFITGAAAGMALFLRQPRLRWLLLTGVALGFAIASRWSSLYAWAVTVLLLGVQWFATSVRASRPDAAERPAAAMPAPLPLLGWSALSLIVVPFVIYFATYIPNVLQGPGTLAAKLFTANGPNGVGWVKTFTLQRDMYIYHSTLQATHPYASRWWSWPLELRPVWYYFKGENGMISGVWCIGNVFLWWASVPAFLTAAYLGWRSELRRTGLLGPLLMAAAYGLGQWLAWGVKERALDFMHYYFECMPFACVALAYLGYRMWTAAEGTPRQGTTAERLRRAFVVLYAVAVLAWFLFYYPLLSAYPISQWYYGQHLWLGRAWI